MEIRNATPSDQEQILRIYETARAFMARTGNPNQWGTNRPAKEQVIKDIELQQSYVCIGEDGLAHGVFAFIPGPDPTYGYIEDGAWCNDEPYSVIHRIAGDGTVPGILSSALDFCHSRCTNLRIDTHHDNKVMQHLLQKNGFTRCGIIYLANGSPRIAYHLVMEK